jgi:geranylgeranylglycerol-phosphate geranylgeranyltransferase
MAFTIREKIAIYIQLIRPFTLVPPAVAVLAGGFLAIGFYDQLSFYSPPSLWIQFDFIPLFVGALTYAMLNGASNAYNQVSDLKIDTINRPNRPIPAGKISIREALGFTFTVYGIGLVIAYIISFSFFVVTAICLIITTLYSTPPVYLKKRFILSTTTIALCQSWLFLLAGWVIYSFANPWEPTFWFIGSVLFILLVGACGTKDFTEVQGDGRYGMKTLPFLYGNEKAAKITGPFFVLPFVLIPIGVYTGILVHRSIFLLILAVYGMYININMKNLIKPRHKGENSPAWRHYYFMLMALQLSFSAVYLS